MEYQRVNYRSGHLEVFFRKGVLKICCKFTGEHPCQSVISITLQFQYTSTWVFSCKFAAYFQYSFRNYYATTPLHSIHYNFNFEQSNVFLKDKRLLFDVFSVFFCVFDKLTRSKDEDS